MFNNKASMILIALIATLGLAACAKTLEVGSVYSDYEASGMEKKSASKNGGRGPASANGISHHVYDEIYQYGNELQGYGLYTYVLFPQKAAPGSDVANRYTELIRQIKATTDTAKVGLDAGWLPEQSNLFCLPAGDADTSRIFSLKLFDRLRHASGSEADHLLPSSSPGPFLISVAHPISSLSGDVPMLVANLSTTHPDAFAEVVAAYKTQLQLEAVDETSRFTSLRLSLLSWIFKANENLTVVKVALAAWE